MSRKFGALNTKFVSYLVLWFCVFNQVECQSSHTSLSADASAITKHVCPTNWVPLISSCYYFSKVRTTWTKANSSCRTLGGYLAVPKNSVENNAIWKVAVEEHRHLHPWIGLVRHTGATFYTVHGSEAHYTAWRSGEPNNFRGSEDCVHFYNTDRWNDSPCSYAYNFICERPKLSAQSSSIRPTTTITVASTNAAMKFTATIRLEKTTNVPPTTRGFSNVTFVAQPSSTRTTETTTVTSATAAMNFTTTIRPGKTTNVPRTTRITVIQPPSTRATVTTTVTSATAAMSFTTTIRPEKTTNVPRTTRITGSCPSDRESTIWGIFSWPETIVGSVAKIACPQNSGVLATRCCNGTNILWEKTNARSCPELKETSRKIFDLSKKTLNSTNVVRVTEEIANLTSAVEKLIPDDIGNVASALEKIVQVKGMANEVADGVFSAVDNILDASFNVVAESQKDSDSSGRILQLLDNLLENINTSKDGFNRTLKNFAVDISTVSVSSFPGLTFTAKLQEDMSAPLQAQDIVKKSSDQVTTSSSKATSIVLPKTLFNDTVYLNSSESQAVIFSLYKDTKFFQVNPSVLTNNSLNSYVIAGSIRNQSIKNLESPVVLSFSSLKRGNKYSALCVYWNFSVGDWSRDGCTLQRVEEDGTVICHCNHLTNFAMLMDINTDGETLHTEILSIISYIGCAVSLVGLVLTIITILLFKDFRTKAPSKLLLNFCIALSLTLIVFLSAAERSKVSSMAKCRAAAVALHYFVLATFMWMAIEAFNMYIMFIRVMPQYIRHFTTKCCIVAWGTPAVIVSITLGTSLDSYGGSKYCRLYGIAFIVSFLAPVVLILIGNTIAFVLIFRALVTSGSEVAAQREVSRLKQARQGFAIMVLLGLTWLFGILAVKDAKLVFQYLFCIFNSLQGLLVFIFYCLLSPGTRKKYRFTLKKNSKNAHRKENRTQGNQLIIDMKSEKTGTNIPSPSRTILTKYQSSDDGPLNDSIELREY